jgi:hypothetical protein
MLRRYPLIAHAVFFLPTAAYAVDGVSSSASCPSVVTETTAVGISKDLTPGSGAYTFVNNATLL